MAQRSRKQSHNPVPRSGLSYAAIRRVFGAGWQRCRVHWMRNALSYIPTTQQSMVTAALRQTFLQPDRARRLEAL
jgi:putative transposase